MPLKGDTVRFEVMFRGFDGSALDYEPDKVTFRIYDEKEEEILSKELGEHNKVDSGEYFYDYTIPRDHEGVYYYEFEGLYRNRPYVVRDDFNVTFD